MTVDPQLSAEAAALFRQKEEHEKKASALEAQIKALLGLSDSNEHFKPKRKAMTSAQFRALCRG